ncbi:MAG: S9 family peptidase [Verrucomicrobiota bacterium]|nr:S9 family peptidase [Verrucomicrobiota bacterium]
MKFALNPSRRALLVVCLAACASQVFSAEPETADLQHFRELAETRNYSLGEPVSPQLTPDGRAVIFLRGGPRDPVLRLYEFTLADQKLRELLAPEKLLGGGAEEPTPEERSRRERERQSLKGFTNFQLTKDGTKLLVSLSGKLFVLSRADSRLIELPEREWIDPRFSPDGTAVAAVRAGELHVIDIANHADIAVTSGANALVQHGVAEFVAQDEMDRHEGFWWSPDGQWLAYEEVDNTGVETRFISDPLHPELPPAQNFYPRAGTNNAKTRLGIVARRGGATRWMEWDREKFPYLARVVWKEGNAPLCLLVQNRAQQEEVLLTADPKTGATRELLRETDRAWLNLDKKPMPVWLKDGSQFLWTTEKRGGWQLELHSADGALVREISPPAFGLEEFVAPNEFDHAVVVAGGSDPRERQLFRFSLHDAAEPQRLTSEAGRHDAIFGEYPDVFLHQFHLSDGRSGWEILRTKDNGKIAELPSVAEHPSTLPNVEITRTAGERPMDAALVRPRDFKKDAHYPVILDVYAGPTSKQVVAQPDRYLIDQWMADRGYLVAVIDGRGTPGHGREWQRAIRGNFIDIALEDQIAGLQALAKKEPAMDLGRVGVVGWSFGGYFSAMATIRRPDVFRCAVAGAPVVTWENYDTHYTERYLGLPGENPEAYRVSSALTYAAELKRPLLLIHGLTDDNVYFQHSAQLAAALFDAGKSFTLLPLLGTHMVSDPIPKLRRQQRILEFFDAELRSERDARR